MRRESSSCVTAETPARRLLTGPIICRRLGISRWTWQRWVKAQIAPQPVPNVPGHPKWLASEIERFEIGAFNAAGRRSYFAAAR